MYSIVLSTVLFFWSFASFAQEIKDIEFRRKRNEASVANQNLLRDIRELATLRNASLSKENLLKLKKSIHKPRYIDLVSNGMGTYEDDAIDRFERTLVPNNFIEIPVIFWLADPGLLAELVRLRGSGNLNENERADVLGRPDLFLVLIEKIDEIGQLELKKLARYLKKDVPELRLCIARIRGLLSEFVEKSAPHRSAAIGDYGYNPHQETRILEESLVSGLQQIEPNKTCSGTQEIE
jgi:hypothetical protein